MACLPYGLACLVCLSALWASLHCGLACLAGLSALWACLPCGLVCLASLPALWVCLPCGSACLVRLPALWACLPCGLVCLVGLSALWVCLPYFGGKYFCWKYFGGKMIIRIKLSDVKWFPELNASVKMWIKCFPDDLWNLLPTMTSSNIIKTFMWKSYKTFFFNNDFVAQ